MARVRRKSSGLSHVSRLTWLVFTAIAAVSPCCDAMAEDFRVETKIFAGENETPISETTTLFYEGNVYDFIKSPAQTAVFTKSNGQRPSRFILLNDEQKLRTEFPTEKLATAMEKVRAVASRHDDPFLKFAANPDFEETFDATTGKLVLASHMESYTVETQPMEHADAAKDYRNFLDWYAQLNTLLVGGPPPQPRLELNKALARRKVLPLKVERSRIGEKEPLRAEHEFTWRLSQDDKKRIDEVQAALAGYRKVENEEFRNAADGETNVE